MAVWFITGASRGFGRELARAALDRGDQVVATARDPRSLGALNDRAEKRLLTVPLDVRDQDQARAAVAAAIERFHRIDVLVNNAGYGLFGSIEETPDDGIRDLFDTNVFGLLNVTRAALPVLRGQRAGHVLNMSSSAGFSAGAGRGLYGASKFAVEAISEALHAELAPLGICVTVVEPGSFRTDFLTSDSRRAAAVGIEDYRSTVGALLDGIEQGDGRQPGDPERAAAALLEIAGDADAPLRLQLGTDAVTLVEAKLHDVQETLDRWRPLALSTDFR